MRHRRHTNHKPNTAPGRHAIGDRPRLKPGQGLRGPEPRGCYGTGFAPVIHHHVCFPGYYLVGPDLAVQRVREWILFRADLDHIGKPRAEVRNGRTLYITDSGTVHFVDNKREHRRRVVVRLTRAAAYGAFEKLVNTRLAENEDARQAELAERKRLVAATPGSEQWMGAALALGDR